MELTTVWFIAIATLWVGYFVLEGFDFGVGMLSGLLGRSERDRRVMINTIGPVWDGNEVWLLTAGGAMFAAFPNWYATLFSGFYLPLLLILVALILRGVAFEYRGKGDTDQWRRSWDRCILFGSFTPALIWGVAFANMVRGVKIDAAGDYTGTFFDLFSPYALLGGATTLALFLLHGGVFLALKTTGEVRQRAHTFAKRMGPVAVLIAGAFLWWTMSAYGSMGSWIVAGVAAALLVFGVAMTWAGRDGWAFAGTFGAIGAAVASLFLALFPNVMPSTLSDNYSLTTTNASSTHYTLTIMTWVAALFLPLVVGYQAWTYWVFRKRIG